MIFIEGPRVISPFPSGLGVARPRSEPRHLLLSGRCLSVTWASSLPDPAGEDSEPAEQRYRHGAGAVDAEPS
jgi:hypothetical protein